MKRNNKNRIIISPRSKVVFNMGRVLADVALRLEPKSFNQWLIKAAVWKADN